MLHCTSEDVIQKYWEDNYVATENKTLCSLCGNVGVIDTRKTAVSNAGFNAGRKNYCICPNGQLMRRKGIPL